MSETMEQPTVETEKPKRPWILPSVVGVGAFLIGVGVGRFEGRLGARFVNDRRPSRDPTATYEGTYDVKWIIVGPVPFRSHRPGLRRSAVPPTTDQALWVSIG